MNSVKKIFYTTVVLTLTSFLMKTVAVWFNVYLSDLVGSFGIGIFQLILSIYALSKTLAYGGMNLAATRLCIDDHAHLRYNIKKLLLCAFLMGLIALAILYLFADVISTKWVLSESAASSFRILSFSLPFLSMASVFYGYMTAVRKMSRYSLIQMIEQLSRIGITVFFLKRAQSTDIERALFLISFGITASEIISFSLSLLSYWMDMLKNKIRMQVGGGFFSKMLRISVPDAFGSYIRSGLNTVEHLLIPKGIRRSGFSTEKALSDYGTVQGMALPVILYPSSILGVLSGLLVPEIAECKLKDNKKEISYIINRVLSLAIIFSFAVMVVMLVFSKELGEAIYQSTEAGHFIRIIAPLIPVMYLDMTTDGMLKGLDLQLAIMKINVIDSVLCVVLVYFLVPKMAVNGYVVTIYIAEIINFLMSFYKLGRTTKIRIRLGKHLLFPLLSALLANLIGHCFTHLTKQATVNLVIGIVIGLMTYYVLLRITGSIDRADLKWFQKITVPISKKEKESNTPPIISPQQEKGKSSKPGTWNKNKAGNCHFNNMYIR